MCRFEDKYFFDFIFIFGGRGLVASHAFCQTHNLNISQLWLGDAFIISLVQQQEKRAESYFIIKATFYNCFSALGGRRAGVCVSADSAAEKAVHSWAIGRCNGQCWLTQLLVLIYQLI